MAGYDDTKKKIFNALLGRPSEEEIQPDKHQEFALNLLEYIRGVEITANGPLVGVAYENTVPIQPDSSRAAYIAGVAQEKTAVFENFIQEDGRPVTIKTGEMEGNLVILIWNTRYWSYESIPTNIISQSNQANFYYNLSIRKTYASVADMNADSVNPIGTDGRLIKIGEPVTVVNSAAPSENGYYSYEGSENGWKFQSGFNFEVVQTTGTDANRPMSQKAITDELELKANHGYTSNPKTLKEVDDNLAQLADDVEDLDDRIVELELHKNPMVVMTKNEYDALEIKDPDTYYLIMED